MVLSVPAFLAALVAMFSSAELVPLVLGDNTGVALLGMGGILLIVGVVLLVVSPKKKPMAQGAVVVAAPQQIEIKRTEMNWASNAAKAPSDEMQTQLDAINQKIGQAKVRYGVGELSGETYKMLLADFEKEKTEIQRRILDAER
ncbi:MAG TPA: hypothetical protein VGB18_04810 [Candidatus Thermoplasmatota archaeon]